MARSSLSGFWSFQHLFCCQLSNVLLAQTMYLVTMTCSMSMATKTGCSTALYPVLWLVASHSSSKFNVNHLIRFTQMWPRGQTQFYLEKDSGKVPHNGRVSLLTWGQGDGLTSVQEKKVSVQLEKHTTEGCQPPKAVLLDKTWKHRKLRCFGATKLHASSYISAEK